MKKLIYILFAAAVLLAAFLPGSGEQENATTTVMIYMCGSNLESRFGLATADILEMLDSGVDFDYTNVLLMGGGTEEWRMSAFDPDVTGIYRLHAGGAQRICPPQSMNMGESETLSLFLNTAVNRFKTDRYILILWDHGCGPLKGVCLDENYENDSLSLFELREGLLNSPFAGRKLDMIGFDACLMGSLETAWVVSPFAEYMVASAEREPGSGWDYSFLGGIEEDASVTDTGKRMIDAYIASFPEDYGSALTLSLIDLSCTAAVTEAMEAYFSNLEGAMTEEDFQNLSAIRYGAQGYGRDYHILNSEDYDMVDIVGLLKACADSGFPQSHALMSALDSAIVASGSNLEGAYGLSVYFPYHNRQEYVRSGADFLNEIQFCPEYEDFLKSFQDYLQGEAEIDWTGLVPVVSRCEDGFEAALALSDAQMKDMVSARLVLLDSVYPQNAVNTCYTKSFDVSKVTRKDGGISARYGDETLIFTYTDQNGSMHRVGPIEFTALDSGECRVDVLAANLSVSGRASYDEPGISHMLRLILSPPDENGDCHVNSYMVYDSAVGGFTNRTGDAIENYRYLYFMSYERFAVREEGLLLPYEAWSTMREDVSGDSFSSQIVRSGDISASVDWGFRVETGYGLRYAAFEITDSRNNTFMTEIVPIRPFSQSTLYSRSAAVEDMPIDVDLQVVCDSPDQITAWISLTNRSEDDVYVFEGRSVAINGQPIEEYSGEYDDWARNIDLEEGRYDSRSNQGILYTQRGNYWVIAAPGETVTLFVTADIMLVVDHLLTGYLDTISMSIDIIDYNTKKYMGSLENVTLAPHVFFADIYENFR